MMGGEIEVSLQELAKGEVPSGLSLSNHREKPESRDPPSVDHQEDLYTDMSLGTLVELTLEAKKLYGTIRWIGHLPDFGQEIMVGLELVNK